MLFAHGPAGYLLTHVLARTAYSDIVDPQRTDRLYQVLMVAGVVGAICPDFDFIYHIFIDSDRTSHHKYITHLPLFWMGLWGVLFAIGQWRKDRSFCAVVTTFCASAVLHLAFDTLTGKVYWFAPISRAGLNIFKVADVNVWWVKNYVYHWTFLIEVAITTVAMVVFLRVRESAALIADLFRRHEKLRRLSWRIALCALGVGLIALVGSMRFSIDNKIFHKTLNLKHRVERKVPSL
jgi:hypothetical protein